MINPIKEIPEYLEKLVRQYLFITGMNRQLEIMREWEAPNRIEALNEGSYFFRLVSYSFTRTIFIELAKFISKNEERSLIDFLEKAKMFSKSIFPAKYNQEIENRESISTEEYTKIIDSQLQKIQEQEKIITSIKKRRDTVFAHTDSKYFNNPNIVYEHFPISLSDVDNLMLLITDILRTHHSFLLNSDIDLEIKSLGNVDNILINNRAFRRVWKDKRIIECGIKPFQYKLDDYLNGNEY